MLKRYLFGVVALLVAGTISLLAQGPAPAAPPARPIDLTGYWSPVMHEDFFERGDGGGIGTWGGFTVNEAGRLWALSYNFSRLTLRHHQCDAYIAPHLMRAVGNFRIWEERDSFNQRLVAIHVWGQTTEGHRIIWMDGRPHPPAWAPHTFRGFSTGEFVGSALRVYTTHMKQEWQKRNGLPQSDQATVVEYFTRHGNRLNNVTVTTDPVFLTEPMVRSTDFLINPADPQAWLYACDDGEQVLDRPADDVPHYLFGKQPYLNELPDKYQIPVAASLGGAEGIYPEYVQRIKTLTAADAEALRSPKRGIPNETSKAVNPEPNDGEIHTYKLRDTLYVLLGDGSNIVVSAGPQGAFIVDTGAGKLTDKVIAAIRKLTDKPIQFIANTSARPHHVGGNAKLADAGADLSLVGSFFQGQGGTLGAVSGFFREIGGAATMIAHSNVQRRMQDAKYPNEAVPADTFLEARRRKFYNGEGVEMFHMPNAATDGDSIVYFRRADVIVTGDLFTTTEYPFIDVANGGTIQGVINALNNILDRTVFEHQGDGGTIIVPGHGYISNEHEVLEHRDMAVIVRDRVQAMLNEGATLEQVLAARLTADYDTRYGANTGDWTTAKFVEAVYKTLKPAAAPAPARSR